MKTVSARKAYAASLGYNEYERFLGRKISAKFFCGKMTFKVGTKIFNSIEEARDYIDKRFSN